MNKKILFLLFLALGGFAASILMTRLHYQVAGRGFQEKSFCNLSEFVDCDTAVASRYAEIRTGLPFLGRIPTSELGILYYLLLCLGLIYAGLSPKGRRPTLSFFAALSCLAVVHTFIYAYLSLFKLGVLCLLCLTTYLANIGLFLVFPKALELRYRELPRFFMETLKSFPKKETGLSLAFILIGLLFFRGLNPQAHKVTPELPAENYLKMFESVPRKETPNLRGPTWGSPDDDAQVVLVEFSDFQCPFCRLAAFNLKPHLKEFRDRVKLVFMNYPLDSACNPQVPHSMHPVACLAAKAALCADQQGRFWDYHDKVFENQKKLSRETLLQLASEVGLDRARFEQCLVSEEVSERLKEDIEAGANLQVMGTPAVFINGRPFRDWTNPQRLRLVIESELSRGPAQFPAEVAPSTVPVP